MGAWIQACAVNAYKVHSSSESYDSHNMGFSRDIELLMQVPALNIFESSYRRGKFDASRKMSNGSLMEFAKVYPMDAVYDTPEEVPEDVSFNDTIVKLGATCVLLQHQHRL